MLTRHKNLSNIFKFSFFFFFRLRLFVFFPIIKHTALSSGLGVCLWKERKRGKKMKYKRLVSIIDDLNSLSVDDGMIQSTMTFWKLSASFFFCFVFCIYLFYGASEPASASELPKWEIGWWLIGNKQTKRFSFWDLSKVDLSSRAVAEQTSFPTRSLVSFSRSTFRLFLWLFLKNCRCIINARAVELVIPTRTL